MKYSVSNIALPAYHHEDELLKLRELGLVGLEIAPSRAWKDTWHGLSNSDVEAYRGQIHRAELSVVGFHSLIFDHPELGLFKDPDIRRDTLHFMAHLSGICRDLGGKTLIYGSGRRRGSLSLQSANEEALKFFIDLIPLIEAHDPCFCFEPLGPNDSDFINSVNDSLRLVEQINHPSLRMQLDAKALMENGEEELKSFIAAKPYLVHFHANEPKLEVLGSSGLVNHAALGKYLKQVGYTGYVSIEQRMINEDSAVANVAQSAAVLKECYK